MTFGVSLYKTKKNLKLLKHDTITNYLSILIEFYIIFSFFFFRITTSWITSANIFRTLLEILQIFKKNNDYYYVIVI